MEARTVSLPPVASHDGAERCVPAIELSKKSWIVAVNTPLSEKISRYTLKPCDCVAQLVSLGPIPDHRRSLTTEKSWSTSFLLGDTQRVW
jgi:hypothetical protein